MGLYLNSMHPSIITMHSLHSLIYTSLHNINRPTFYVSMLLFPNSSKKRNKTKIQYIRVVYIKNCVTLFRENQVPVSVGFIARPF